MLWLFRMIKWLKFIKIIYYLKVPKTMSVILVDLNILDDTLKDYIIDC